MLTKRVLCLTVTFAGVFLLIVSAIPADASCFCTCSGSYCGTSNHDTISGSSAGQCIDGKAGDDTIYGNGGDDTLLGGSGDDTLKGGSGEDCLDGGSGQDHLDGGPGTDDCFNGPTFVSCNDCEPPAMTCTDYNGGSCSNCPATCVTEDCLDSFCFCESDECICLV